MKMTNRVNPVVCAEYDEEADAYEVEIQLPGVNRENVDLKVLPGGFMVRAPRSDNDTEYIGSYAFCCPVDEEKVEANFKNGLLKAHFKLQQPYDKAHKVEIS
jgi:HSP20 family molecular chaperone IbpA